MLQLKWVVVVVFLLFLPSFLHPLHDQHFDYPTANLSTLWTNSPNLDHVVSFPDGSTVRPILLRGHFGPSFACGFFCKGGTCGAFLFAVFIVYTNSGSQITRPTTDHPQVVWSANRNHPLRENATLQLTKDGDLVLRDADSSIVWSTDTSGKSVFGMNLTQTGNLVLFDGNNSSVWESFDHPTDVLIPGQKLVEGQRLISNVSALNRTEGQFYLSTVSHGLQAFVDSNPPQLYYQFLFSEAKNGVDPSYVMLVNGSLELFGLVTDQFMNESHTVNLLPRASSIQYMRLESDGHLMLYEWGVEGWRTLGDVLKVFQGDCAYPTVCGDYGICSSGQCSCPRGNYGDSDYFRQVNERVANLGCSMVTSLSCQSTQYHRLLALNDVSYFNYIDTNTVVLNWTTEESCKQACLRNCSCKAALFQFGVNASTGSCFLPSQLFSLMNNKPEVSHYNSAAYIKVQVPLTAPMFSPVNGLDASPSSSAKSSRTARFAVILGSIFGALFGAFLIIAFVYAVRRRRKGMEEEEEDHFDQVPGMPTRFSFEELKVATENFYRKLGEGGFGSVFEGTLGNGMRIAVKRLDGVGQGKKEFLAEVETIGSIHHINLVRLIGFCAEKLDRLLVYEYMCSGSLDKWIFYRNQNTSLDWKIRRKIITDIAKGLAYLHEEWRQRIAHLDVKPQNILLDGKFNSKISDFGLCKLIDRDVSNVMTRMRGTPGYLAPEWLTSKITEKADVYSFGVVVSEIVCGRKNLDYSQPEESIHLIGLLKDMTETGRLLDIVDDHSIDIELHGKEVVGMMRLAMWCLQSDSNRRPSMSMVVKVLEGALDVEANLEYNFFTPTTLVSRDVNGLGVSAPPSASILSGPR